MTSENQAVPGRAVTETIELRVHGVGGATAAALLGEESGADVVQVGGEGPSTFHARRRDLHIEAYTWGALTRRSWVQPLWLILLPFTLMNVAGWTHPPPQELREGAWGRFAWRAYRIVLAILGLGLTATYVFWSANAWLNFAHRIERFLWLQGAQAKVVAAGVLLWVPFFAILLVASTTLERFESHRALLPRDEALGPTRTARRILRSPLRPSILPTVYQSITTRDALDVSSFWSRAEEARALLGLHMLVTIVALGGTVAWAWLRAGTGEGLRLGRFPTFTTEGLLWGVVALGLIHLAGWKRPLDTKRFRWATPAVASAAAMGLASGFFYGVIFAFDRTNPDRTNSLATAVAFSTFAVVFILVLLGVWIWRRSRHERERARLPNAPEHVPPNTAEEARERNGATPTMCGKVAWGRAFSQAARHVDLVITAGALAFVVSALAQLRFGAWEWTFITLVGNSIAAAAAAAALSFLLYRSWRPGERRVVGIIWDALTFWPRRFHPLAVRPYAERAVPDLWERIRHHVGEKRRRVVLWAHSQGTVLAYATLLQLRSDVTREVALVTCGSPLRQMYQTAFPAYFDATGFQDLRGRLFSDKQPEGLGWRNFFHLTDYIGKEVFADLDVRDPSDVPVPDPAQEPTTAQLPLQHQLDPWPDTPRTAWTELGRHSLYYREQALHAWVWEVRCRMGEPDLPC